MLRPCMEHSKGGSCEKRAMGDDWVVDSLLGYLQSLVWRSPVDKFIDQNCTVFDTEEENKFSYTEIYNKYREMVDELLESFTAELGITPKQLAEACSQSSTLGESHQSLFEQILATEDFLLFKSIMVQRNIDLELQALKLVQRQLGHSPEAYQQGGGSDQEAIDRMKRSRRAASEEEERILRKVLEESKKEYERQKSLEEEEMEKKIMLAKQESLKSIKVSQREKKEAAKTDSQQKKEVPSLSPSQEKDDQVKGKIVNEQDNASSKSPSRAASSKEEALPSLTPEHKGSIKVSDAASLWLESAKADVGKDKSGTDAKPITASNLQDIKAREAYLRQQRDHLIKMKNKARSRADDGPSSSKKPTASAKASPSKSKSNVKPSTEQMAKNAQAEGAQQKQDSSSLVSRRVKSSSRVLCSAIADKLRIEQN